MKLLVTGGAGFIGSNFIHHMLESRPDCEIVNLDALTYAGNLENLKDIENDPRYDFVRGDIADKESVNQVFETRKPEAVVHFAAESHVDRSIHDPGIFLKTNVLGTHVLLDAALRHGKIRFHHISTDEVFGSLGPDDPRFDENTAYDPRSPYSASKAASDHLARAYFHTFGLPVTISNCSNNYGPYMFPEKLFPLFITNLIDGKKVPLYGDGLNVRDWLHVRDHAEAISLILEKGRIGETYCIGGNNERSNREIAGRILALMGKGEEMIEFVTDRPGHDRRYAIDFSKIRNELGWEPRTDFDQGIRSMIGWYRGNEDWWRKLLAKRQ